MKEQRKWHRTCKIQPNKRKIKMQALLNQKNSVRQFIFGCCCCMKRKNANAQRSGRVANKDVGSWLEIFYWVSCAAAADFRFGEQWPATLRFHLFATSCQPANISASIVVECSGFFLSIQRRNRNRKREEKKKKWKASSFSQRLDVHFVVRCKAMQSDAKRW